MISEYNKNIVSVFDKPTLIVNGKGNILEFNEASEFFFTVKLSTETNFISILKKKAWIRIIFGGKY